MPQRNSITKIPEPISLRRSPRLIQLKDSPKTPNPISKNPPLTTRSKKKASKNSQIVSRIVERSLVGVNECEIGSNGSGSSAKLANGSRGGSGFGGGIFSVRRSPKRVSFRGIRGVKGDSLSEDVGIGSNVSKRGSNLGSGVDSMRSSSKGCRTRRSGRLKGESLSEVSSLGMEEIVNVSKKGSNLGSGIVSVRPSLKGCSTRISGRLKRESLSGIDSLVMKDAVDSPVTPIGVGEKKCRFLDGQCSDGETSGSLVLSLGDSERRVTRNCVKKIGGNVEGRKIENNRVKVGEGVGRRRSYSCKDMDGVKGKITKTSGSLVLSLVDSERRITRSCAKKFGGNVETGKMENSKLKDSNLFDKGAGGGGSRKCVRSVRGAIGDGSCKGKGDDGRRILVCDLEKAGFDSLSPCATPGVRRGRSCNRKVMDGMKRKTVNSCEQVLGDFERRITRITSKRIAKESDLCGEESERRNTSKGGSRKATKKNEECNGTIKPCRTERGKRVKQASITPFSARLEVEEAALRDISVKEKGSRECGRQDGDKSITESSAVTQGNKLIGAKRKRNDGGLKGRDHGWTNEQEAALQKAYFTAKPSPHFWKRVSKLVPGKSAQECFDKVHSSNLTPDSNKPSSRLKKNNSPSELLLKGDDLLKPIPTKSKKQGKSRQKSHVTRRNVRHLLQKYCHDNEADLFSILEPSGNPLPENLKLKSVHLTPTQSSGSPGSSGYKKRFSRMHLSPTQSLGSPGSSGYKKRLSRLSGVGSPLTSPPVLKKVKNMALHEKYIDQLHVREGKRKLSSLRHSKTLQGQNNGTQNAAQWKNVIKAAKDALVSDARDVIEKFQQSQTNLMEVYSDSEEVLISDIDEDGMGM